MIRIDQHVLGQAKKTLNKEYNKNPKDFLKNVQDNTEKFLPKLAIDPRKFQSLKKQDKRQFEKEIKKNKKEWLDYITQNIESFFEYLAETHWLKLKDDITEGLAAMLKMAKDKEKTTKTDNSNNTSLKKQIAFLEYLSSGDNLKKLITSKPVDLEKITEDILNIIEKHHFVINKTTIYSTEKYTDRNQSVEFAADLDAAKGKIKDLIALTKSDDYFQKIALGDLELLNNQTAFLNLVANDQDLMEFIAGNPGILDEMEGKFFDVSVAKTSNTANNNKTIYSHLTTENSTTFTTDLLSKVFKYKTYRDRTQCLVTLTHLGFSDAYCPYCNLGQLQITKKSNKNATPDKAYLTVDHFIQKYKYPFLALSFYNLIPSCHVCNSMNKGIRDFSRDTHINPFEMSADDVYQFKFKDLKPCSNAVGELSIATKNCDRKDLTFAVFDILAKHKDLEVAKDVHKIILKYHNRVKKDRRLIEPLVDILKSYVPQNKEDILTKKAGKMLRDLVLQYELGANNYLAKNFSQ